jgi:protoheme IX farnesyltransferase
MSVASSTMISASSPRDYITLLKPGVMLLVVFTGAVGMWLAPGIASIHPLLQAVAIFSIALGSGGGAAINMWFDRDIDAIMARTQTRPIPAGRIAADDALVMGLLLSITSVALLGLALNWVAAGWLAFAIFFYAVIYTMLLKRRTPQNIVIGGAAGAFPAVIGWAAVTGDTAAAMPWLLFAIVFLWTPPHFWALALYRSNDYKTARIPMLPVVAGVASTKRHIVAYSVCLFAATIAPLWLGAGLFYGAAATLLSGYFVILSLRVHRSDAARDAMRLFGFSIVYLFVLFAALLVDRVFIAGAF